jgi:transposase
VSDFEARPLARPAALRAALGRVVTELLRVRDRLSVHADRLDNLHAKLGRTDAAIDGILVPIIGPTNVLARLTALYGAGKVDAAQLAAAVDRGWITQAQLTTIVGPPPV